jgi:hypothetical protein
LSPNPHTLVIYLICSCSWSHAIKVWRMTMWRWRCSSSLLNLGSWWWSLSLAMRPNQPPSHGTLSQIPNSHHSSHFGIAIVNYPL